MAKKPPPNEHDGPVPDEPTGREADVLEYWMDPGAYARTKAQDIWSYDSTGHELTVEQQLFCRSYIIDRNPVAALLRLGYSESPAKLKTIATKHLASAEVQACVATLAQNMMARLEVTAESVQRRIAEVAFFDPRGVMEFNHHRLAILDSKYWTLEQARSIQSIKQSKDGVEIRFYDGLRASEMLAKQIQLQPDDSKEAIAAATKAAAEVVVDKLFGVFEKTVAETHPVESPAIEHNKPPVD